MTKLEQCVRLVHALDTAGSIETRYDEDPSPRFDKPMFFATAYSDPDECFEVAWGEGATLEEAIEALHDSLQAAAVRMRRAVDVFEGAAEETAP